MDVGGSINRIFLRAGPRTTDDLRGTCLHSRYSRLTVREDGLLAGKDV